MYYRSPCLFFRNIVRSTSSCFGARQDHYGARGLWPDHPCARGLARPLRALGLLARPLRARGLPRSLSDHGSGTSSLAPRPVLGDCLDHSPTTARGLCVSTTCDRQLAYSWGYSFSFRPCYKAHTSPSSKLGDYIGTMHLPVHLVSRVR